MYFYKQILVFLFHSATCSLGLQQNTRRSSMNIFKREGVSSFSYERCQRLCVYASACASFDWNKETRVCQLNRDSSERNENTQSVSINKISTKAGPCMKRPCSSGHMCVPVASSTDFKCLFIAETAPATSSTSATTATLATSAATTTTTDTTATSATSAANNAKTATTPTSPKAPTAPTATTPTPVTVLPTTPPTTISQITTTAVTTTTTTTKTTTKAAATMTTPFTRYNGCNYTTNIAAGEYTLRTDADGKYSINEHCTVELQAPSLPHNTVLDFTYFDLEEPEYYDDYYYYEEDECHYDTLVILVRSHVVDTLCGTLEPFINTYNNPGDLRLTFTSDDSEQFSGFSFIFRHHIQYCNATINGTSGSFATPPGGYQNNEVCFYTIFTQTPVQLNFTFSKFDIEESPGCEYDSLTMGDDTLCGTLIQSRSYPSNGTFVMKLTTNGSVEKDGFHLSFTSRAI